MKAIRPVLVALALGALLAGPCAGDPPATRPEVDYEFRTLTPEHARQLEGEEAVYSIEVDSLPEEDGRYTLYDCNSQDEVLRTVRLLSGRPCPREFPLRKPFGYFGSVTLQTTDDVLSRIPVGRCRSYIVRAIPASSYLAVGGCGFHFRVRRQLLGQACSRPRFVQAQLCLEHQVERSVGTLGRNDLPPLELLQFLNDTLESLNG